MIRLACSAAVLAACFGLVPAYAQEPGSRQTREFVQAAGQSDKFEILEAQTALAQSSDPQIRAFAQQMIQDHSATSRALRDAAARAGLAPPPEGISTDQAAMLNSLQSQRGRDFDRVYARQQAVAHHSALVVERKYAAEGDQPAIRRVAASASPTIASHLAMAEQMQMRLGEH